MSVTTACAFGIALVVVAINLNYSLLATAIYRLREQHWPARLPLGIPLLGTLTVAIAWFSLPDGHSLRSLLLVLALVDTGGPLAWLLATSLRRRRPTPPPAQPAAPARLRGRTLG